MVKYSDVKDLTTEEFFNNNKFSIDAFNKKYKLEENETYVQALWRVCKEIASVEETKELQKYWAERWFSEIFNGWWHPAGSIMQGAGNPNSVSLANCTTLSLGVRDEEKEWDNLESIIRNTTYSVAKSAAYRQGLGVDFSRLRPRGMTVKNSSNESTGAVHWMGFVDSIGYKVGQKGRIPAMLFSININHPDVEEFIQVKSDYTQIQNANISVQITDEFYKAVKNNEKWKLHFTIPGYKKGDKIYIDSNSVMNDSDYYSKDDNGWYFLSPKDRPSEYIEKEVNAKKLFRLIAENMWKNGEPGIQNIDTAIRYSNSDVLYDPKSDYDTRILSTNACCVVDNTIVATNKGNILIKELHQRITNGEKILAMSYNIEKDVYEFKPILNSWQQRNDITVELEIEQNGLIHKLECSSDHPILTKNRGYVEAISLTEDDDILIYEK